MTAMRRTLILAVTAGLLVPGAALAFDASNAGPQNPDGSAGFSDPDEAPVIPGLQAYGIDSEQCRIERRLHSAIAFLLGCAALALFEPGLPLPLSASLI